MKKKILKLSLALAVVAAAGYTAYSSQTQVQLNGAVLENVEALASGENDSPNYEVRDETTIEIWDEATQTHEKITVIKCRGVGDLVC